MFLLIILKLNDSMLGGKMLSLWGLYLLNFLLCPLLFFFSFPFSFNFYSGIVLKYTNIEIIISILSILFHLFILPFSCYLGKFLNKSHIMYYYVILLIKWICFCNHLQFLLDNLKIWRKMEKNLLFF